MKKVVLDGWTIKDYRYNGVQRYATEIIKGLDKLVSPEDGYELLIRKKYHNLIQLNNMKIVDLDVESQRDWHKAAIKYIWHEKALYVNLGNGIMLGKSAVVAIHDLYSFYDVLNRPKSYIIKRQVSAHINALFCKKIVTVSEYSKKTLMEKLAIRNSKIEIIPNGWQHIKNVNPNKDILSKLELDGNDYFLFLGRLAKNKNIDWIYKVADYLPNRKKKFVIAGELGNEPFSYYSGEDNNIIFSGYVTDAELRALYLNCRAFLLPSFIEGFGIPPMEALYCNVPIIISNTSSLPEIYGDSAHYIDPYKYDYDLDELLQEPVSSGKSVLAKYSWEKSSQLWHELLEELR